MRNFIILLLVICAGVFLLSSDTAQNVQSWLSENLFYLAGTIFAGAGCVWVLLFGKSPNPYEWPESFRQEDEISAPKQKARLNLLKMISLRPENEGEHTLEEFDEPEGYIAKTTEKNGITRWWALFKADDIDNKQ